MTLQSKLLLAQAPLALSLALVGVLSRATLFRLGTGAQNVLKDNHASVLAAEHMRDDADRLALLAERQLTLKMPASADEVSKLRRRFEAQLRFQESNITEVGEREITEDLRAAWQQFQVRYSDLLATSGDPGGALRSFWPALEAVRTGTRNVITVNQDAMVRKSELARKDASLTSGLMLAGTLAAFVLGLFASSTLTTRLVRPLRVLTSAVRRVGEGDLAVRARVEGKDEIAQLASEFNRMTDALGQYRSSSLGELLQVQRASQAAIDSMPDPILILGLDGSILNVNRAAESQLDLSETRPLADADPIIAQAVTRMREHVASGKGAYLPKGLEEALALTTAEGARFFLPRAHPVLGEGGALTGLAVLLQDVTRLRRFDELKNDLVATVAHEFRTPLTSLRMAIHLCAEETVGTLTPKQGDLLAAAREDCERLQSIVDDLLDLSRIQAGRIELALRPVSSEALITQAVEDGKTVATARQIALERNPLTIDRPTFADPERIALVFNNLIGNALRHTAKGGRVELRAAPHDGGVRFEVADTGTGIAAEHIPRLFERFSRIPGSAPGGAGLGLYICKEIVAAHGGTIGVETEPGRGSIFWFTLPGAKSSTEESS
jgi:signal transduction histidine kinase